MPFVLDTAASIEAPVGIETIHDLIQPWVIGCPPPLINLAIRLAQTKFARRTLLWEEELPPLVATPLALYKPELPDGAVMTHLRRVRVGDADYSLDTRVQARLRETGTFAHCSTEKIVALRPIPQAGQQIVITAVLSPTIASTDIPGPLVTHRDHIANGALHYLLSIPRKDWTDMNAASDRRMEFESAISVHAARTARGFASAGIRAPINWF
jgi:hypothetical protein